MNREDERSRRKRRGFCVAGRQVEDHCPPSIGCTGVNVSVYFFLKKLTVILTFHSLGLTL